MIQSDQGVVGSVFGFPDAGPVASGFAETEDLSAVVDCDVVVLDVLGLQVHARLLKHIAFGEYDTVHGQTGPRRFEVSEIGRLTVPPRLILLTLPTQWLVAGTMVGITGNRFVSQEAPWIQGQR